MKDLHSEVDRNVEAFSILLYGKETDSRTHTQIHDMCQYKRISFHELNQNAGSMSSHECEGQIDAKQKHDFFKRNTKDFHQTIILLCFKIDHPVPASTNISFF